MKNSSFSELGIQPEILKAVNDMGFEAPTSIQEKCIPQILAGKDLVGQAQTGTGKTAAFGIPALQMANKGSKSPSVLILTPTRELAIQVTGELIKLAKHVNGVFTVPVYGGQPISRQLKALKKGAQIVVGTPGRVIDHLKRGTLKLGALEMVVLDEADEMLNMGFREDLEQILSYSKGKSQTVMFSATVPNAIKNIMNRWMDKPEMIKVEGRAQTAEGVEQYVMEVRDSMRVEAISRVIDMTGANLTLVFSNTKRRCDSLVQEFQARGFSADALHGDMRQNVRDKVMNKFRNGKIELLVATDVAARGLDVDDIDIVFNYDVPQDPEFYVHRIGRTARAGKSGMAITFSTGRKRKSIRFIEKIIGAKLMPLPMPSSKEVQMSKMESHLDEIVEVLQKGGLREYIDQLEPLAESNYSPIEIAAALMKMKFEK
ncbi:DEAD/DEAH box helicase [Rhodohalobacter sp.]|uniref:DEAD/DEAH box helicase n=1 Tax=Rhodohalobacter sp. TaxID=1974210 RepID=UPI002ACD774B|nr:DEAD/DEAH box helicase [Rhodohalobacter sp.]MDZ7758265.1 DEAD/DEAH box helicase [Rhodohalobacter sp.]